MIVRELITKRRFDALVKKGAIAESKDSLGIMSWQFVFVKDVRRKYTPLTVGTIAEDDFDLISISCTKGMYKAYVKNKRTSYRVEDNKNPYEPLEKYYIPEWMFVDRQKDVDNIIKRYMDKEE